MSKISKIIADIAGILEESSLQWNILYIPSTKSYSIYISDDEPEIKHRCSTCKWWGSSGEVYPCCYSCFEADKWEPKDDLDEALE